MMGFTEVMQWIKDLGLPMVALFYLFKLYTAQVIKVDTLQRDATTALLASNVAMTQLVVAIQNLTAEARKESESRQELLDKLVDRALHGGDRHG